MARSYKIASLVVGLLFVASIFSFLPSVAAYSPFATLQTKANSNTGLEFKGGHGGAFACPTILGADKSVCSTNWSGYADSASSGGVSAVSGSWTVPSLTCPKRGTTYVALWVGIDGYSSSTVEQTGVLGECNSGTASYSAWYEFYPNPSVSISSITAHPGDVFTASVTYSSGVFTTTITDTTTGLTASYSSAVSGALRTSAEWIVERPALCIGFHCSLTTLANFGSASFTSSSATIGTATGTISAFSDVAITMVGSSSGPILAEPSSLLSSGASFTVAYG